MRFKKGDTIEAIEHGRGFEKAVVMNIYTEQKGKNKGKEMYYLKIMCGTATIPIEAEDNYRLVKK